LHDRRHWTAQATGLANVAVLLTPMLHQFFDLLNHPHLLPEKPT
jgi:hypothetical protein